MIDTAYQKGFRNLIVWREAHSLTVALYKATCVFPKHEQYGITSQLRRASSSIGAQLAEGSRMRTGAHRRIYYERAYASAAEVDNFLELSRDLGYLDEPEYKNLLNAVNRVSYLLRQLSDST